MFAGLLLDFYEQIQMLSISHKIPGFQVDFMNAITTSAKS